LIREVDRGEKCSTQETNMKLHMFAGTEAIVMAAKVRYWKLKLCNF
jgi:hypothetical protein